LQQPDEREWKNLSHDYGRIWNLPNCVGAIDGKHIPLQCPRNSGTKDRNFKKFFSIVLLAVVDPKYCFTMVDIGEEGKEGDSTIWQTSNMGIKAENGTLGLPPPSLLPYSETKSPAYFVGDQAFPLKTYLMKPYPGRNTGLLDEFHRVFNYR